MTDDRIAAIRERRLVARQFAVDCDRTNRGCQVPQILTILIDDMPLLLAEIDCLNAELASYKETNPPRMHGEWENGKCGPYFICSECLQVADFDFDFCPNCGADMRANEAAQAALTCQKCRASGDTKVCVDKTSGYVCPHQAALDGGAK